MFKGLRGRAKEKFEFRFRFHATRVSGSVMRAFVCSSPRLFPRRTFHGSDVGCSHFLTGESSSSSRTASLLAVPRATNCHTPAILRIDGSTANWRSRMSPCISFWDVYLTSTSSPPSPKLPQPPHRLHPFIGHRFP